MVKKNNNINCMLKADSCLCEEKIQHKQEERKQEKVHRSTKRKKEGECKQSRSQTCLG